MNLALRVVSGVVLVAVIVGALWIGTPAVATVVGAGAVIGAWELRALLGRTGPMPPVWLMLPLSLWLAIRFVLPAADMAADWGFAAAVVVGLLAGLGIRQSFAGWALATGGATYIGLGLGFWVAIYRWHVPDTTHLGFRLVVLALAGAVIGDTAAYLVGTAIGRHPFFQRISPHKSLEGAVAGAVASILVGAIAGPLLVGLSVPLGAGLGALMAIAAQGGDLVESAIKREAGVKDSGTLIPGHGGLLDRADSLVLLAPVVYCYLKLIAFS
ncbi:MAG: phosphatidate cytidylyltransferase [Candidatus Dormibacteria bacterium]|jgi:phosphatidate cytidylyltransferase